jgi:hypothetical protein
MPPHVTPTACAGRFRRRDVEGRVADVGGLVRVGGQAFQAAGSDPDAASWRLVGPDDDVQRLAEAASSAS